MVLDDACRDWRRTATMHYPEIPNCRPEGEQTMLRYGHLRVFPDHERRNRTYEWHVSVGQKYRIRLRVVAQPRVIEVGYVGRHLRTVRHP